jgi:uncharacterized protein YndB with AHSA1/START domain
VTEQTGRMVRIERTFAASAEDVFDAWTSPEVMRRWFHPAPDWGRRRPRSISMWAGRFAW